MILLRQVAGLAAHLVSYPVSRQSPRVLQQHVRTTVIVKHIWPELPPTEKEDYPLHKYREPQPEARALVMVEDTFVQKQPKLDLLLLVNITGIGQKGEIAPVTKGVAREKLLPKGVAVYPSSENLEKYKDVIETFHRSPARHSKTALKTVAALKTMVLRVAMSSSNPWTLSKSHLRVAFRKMGVEVTEDCIRMPEEDITEPQQLEVQLTINSQTTFTVQAIVYHHDRKATSQTFEGKPLPPVWRKSTKSIEECIAEQL